MAVNVNPPPQIRLPPELAKDKDTRVFFQQLDRMLLQLWKRTGGADDLIDESEQILTSTGSRVSRNAAKIDSLEFIRFNVVEITEDYTALPFEIVICNNLSPITVTLDANAIKNDQIHVKRKPSAAEVTVSGSIDGDTGRIINVANWSDFYVFGETEWAVI